MEIKVINQPAEEPKGDEELLLNEEIVDEDGGTKVIEPSAEAIDEVDYGTLDDEADEPPTPLVKHLREELKRANREKAELLKKATEPKVVRTKKPDLWDDCEGDPDKFEAELLAWKENEARADAQERAPIVPPERERVAQQWQQDLSAYKAKAATLGKPDFDEAEKTVISTLTDAQQSTIVMAAKNPASFIYALGKSPNRLAQLAEIDNPIKLAAEVARIEGARMMARKEPANIDTPLKGGARLSVPTADAEEKRLEKEAERTKDYSKLFAYRRGKRQKAA